MRSDKGVAPPAADPGRRLPLVALVLQWRQDYPNNRPPTRATAISAVGHNPPPAMQKISKEFRPAARRALFSGTRGRGRLPVHRLGGMTDATAGAERQPALFTLRQDQVARELVKLGEWGARAPGAPTLDRTGGERIPRILHDGGAYNHPGAHARPPRRRYCRPRQSGSQ
jgi:hypothetical protein